MLCCDTSPSAGAIGAAVEPSADGEITTADAATEARDGAADPSSSGSAWPWAVLGMVAAVSGGGLVGRRLLGSR